MKRFSFIISAALVLLLTSCIRNDIPFPRIQANFMSLDVKGQDRGTAIDTVAMTATVHFPEEVDIESVRVTGYTLTPGSTLVGNPFEGTIDLSKPYPVILRMYQDYQWKIIGTQDIERYFEIEGQVGATVIDVPARRVIIYISENADITSLKVVKAKLGPTGSQMSPELTTGGTINGSAPVEIVVKAYGREQTWTVYIERVAVSVRTLSVDAWSCVAWINGQGEAGKTNGAQYRLAGTEEWTEVNAADISVDGGAFTARVAHLSPSTAYQARVYSGEIFGEIIDFTTGNTPQLPNSNFDNWWLDRKIWCPWAEGGEPFWGTGNQGAATLGQSNSTPTDDTPDGSGWAAKLETRFVGIGSLGKIAAGNIFAGYYVRTVGTDGVLSFGRPFSERPVKLRGQYKYTVAPISHASAEFQNSIGRPDTCIVWVALIDSDEPLEIRTSPSNRNLFDPEADYTIAYGKFEMAQTIPNYIPFEFEIKYKSTSRKPKYILVTASASKYGDYFTGGNGSTLYLDDLELLYDY